MSDAPWLRPPAAPLGVTRGGVRALLVGALALSACTGDGAAVTDCPRGDLDARYCDVDGDLLADPPAEAGALLDPPRLVFTYTPVEDPALYEGIWRDFTDHLAAVTGRPVSYFTVGSYAAMSEAMRAGRLHVAGFATGSVPLGVNCAGFHPVATMGLGGEISGYEMELITHPESGIRAPGQLAGRRVAFTEQSSNSGFRSPRYVLEHDFGLVEGRDYTAVFSGAHDASILGVANRDYDAAAIANEVLDRMVQRGVVSRDELFTLYRSETFPTTAYGHVYNLTPELRDRVRDAFFTFAWQGTALAREFAGRADSFVPVGYAEAWELVRTVARETGESLSCP
jgi:phosphonate transport system substrate-binding protein